MIRQCLLIIAMTAVSAAAGDEADFGALAKRFSTNRHELANSLIKRLEIQEPQGMKEFFEAAEKGDWLAVSNRFRSFQVSDDRRDGVRPEVQNELWSPILETLGMYEVIEEWKGDSALIAMFYKPVMSSMPRNSIYLGGTDHGRFVITAVNAVMAEPQVFCITQNALADISYMAHLRAVYGKELWIPQQEDSARAFQQYVTDVQSGKCPACADIKIENGRVQVSGVLGVMQINGILCKEIFDRNRKSHDFFVEESYVIDWMYPYLEPYGFIMKLNKEPLPELAAGTVERDRDFWKKNIPVIMENPGFKSSPVAQKAFAKLRCGIADVYVFRKQYKAAEACYEQAFKLCAYSEEVYSRFARMYEKRGQIKEAIGVIEKFTGIDPEIMNKYTESGSIHSIENAKQYLSTLRSKIPLDQAENKQLTELIKQLGTGDSGARAAVRAKLTAFGARALPLLETYRESEDPEVSVSVKELIRQIQESVKKSSSENAGKATAAEKKPVTD